MHAQALIRLIEEPFFKTDLPAMNVGDNVRVSVKIVEGGKERVQAFEGTIICIRNHGLNKSITVRRVFQGIGVERVFPVHSPRIESFKVTRRGSVRRAKLFYLRGRVGKATRVKEKV